MGAAALLSACAQSPASPVLHDAAVAVAIDSAAPSAEDASVAPAPDLLAPAGDAGAACVRMAAPADRARKVVISLPYDAAGNASSRYQILDLSTTGALTLTAHTFTMGRATGGPIAFTPDGAVGVVAQDDGSLGIFRLDESGLPTVVAAAFKGTFYATRVVMDPRGDRVYVLDTEWRASGGGIHSVRLACDGTPTDEGLRVASKLPYALALLGGDRALLASADVLGSSAGKFAYLLDWNQSPTLLGEVSAFGDDQPIVTDAVVTVDGKHVLIADNSEFSGIPNRVAVVGLVGMPATSIIAEQVITPLKDPVALVASPFDDTVLVVSGYANAIYVLDGPGGGRTAFSLRGPLAYLGKSPQLPGPAVMVARGALAGRVLVAENLGVRAVQLAASAKATDLGLTPTGAGTDAIPGAIGVQP